MLFQYASCTSFGASAGGSFSGPNPSRIISYGLYLSSPRWIMSVMYKTQDSFEPLKFATSYISCSALDLSSKGSLSFICRLYVWSFGSVESEDGGPKCKERWNRIEWMKWNGKGENIIITNIYFILCFSSDVPGASASLPVYLESLRTGLYQVLHASVSKAGILSLVQSKGLLLLLL